MQKRVSAPRTLLKVMKCTEDTSKNQEPVIILLEIIVGSSTRLREFEKGISTSLREFKQVAARRLVDEQMSS